MGVDLTQCSSSQDWPVTARSGPYLLGPGPRQTDGPSGQAEDVLSPPRSLFRSHAILMRTVD